MKTVFSKTREVAAIWAAQSQAEARTGSNTWMSLNVLNSYSTAIARIAKDRNGRPVALVSERQYSSGTSKVQGEAADEAKKLGIPVFRVHELWPDKDGHETNLQRFEERIDAALDKVETAKGPEAWRREAFGLIQTAHTYATYFAQPWNWHGRDPQTVLSKKERETAA